MLGVVELEGELHSIITELTYAESSGLNQQHKGAQHMLQNYNMNCKIREVKVIAPVLSPRSFPSPRQALSYSCLGQGC